uniref:IP05494p n=1 Tax=Drosophila melanogaster TaxID=7227 RepID=Q4V6A0_DROME|nr:IP05494p [Drosophila melanogaster]
MGIEMRCQDRRILLPSLLLLILMIGGVQATMKLCGRKLPETLSKLCVYGFKLPETLSKLCVYGFNAMTKRTLDPVNFNQIDGFEDRSLLERLLSDSSVQMLKTRRLRDGVFDECCLKSCTMDEVLRYCAAKPRT